MSARPPPMWVRPPGLWARCISCRARAHARTNTHHRVAPRPQLASPSLRAPTPGAQAHTPRTTGRTRALRRLPALSGRAGRHNLPARSIHLLAAPRDAALRVHAAHEGLPQVGLGQVRREGLALLDDALRARRQARRHARRTPSTHSSHGWRRRQAKHTRTAITAITACGWCAYGHAGHHHHTSNQHGCPVPAWGLGDSPPTHPSPPAPLKYPTLRCMPCCWRYMSSPPRCSVHSVHTHTALPPSETHRRVPTLNNASHSVTSSTIVRGSGAPSSSRACLTYASATSAASAALYMPSALRASTGGIGVGRAHVQTGTERTVHARVHSLKAEGEEQLGGGGLQFGPPPPGALVGVLGWHAASGTQACLPEGCAARLLACGPRP